MSQIQSISYPEYTTVERDLLTGLPSGYKIINSDTGLVEIFDSLEAA